MAFPGTISLKPETLKAELRDYCVSLSRRGFRKICILPSHGGNFRIIREALAELNDADCKVAGPVPPPCVVGERGTKLLWPLTEEPPDGA